MVNQRFLLMYVDRIHYRKVKRKEASELISLASFFTLFLTHIVDP